MDPLEKSLRLKDVEISFIQPLEFSEAKVYLNADKTPMKRVQSSESATQYGFGSSGVFAINNKVMLSGTLDVNRKDEKAVPYILTDERTTDQNYISNPSYFYAPRKSNWLNQNYELSAKIGYNPLKNLFVILGAGGQFLKSYSNADPRPEIGNFRYIADGKIGYTYKSHGIFLTSSYFNNKRESDITYNVSELNAPTYFDTYIRFNKGYGNYYYNNGYTKTEYRNSGFKYGAEYHYTTPKSFLSLGYENQYYIDRMYWYYNQQLKDANNLPYYIRTKMKLTGLKTDRNTFFADYLGKLGSYRWTSSLIVRDQKDVNFDYTNINTSYVAYNTSVAFANYFSKYTGKNELCRVGLSANYGDQDVRDFSVVMHRKLRFVHLNLEIENEIRTATNQKLSAAILPGVYLPIRYLFDFQPYLGSENNIFIANVARPDYAYDTSRKLSLGLRLKYIIDHKKVRYEIFAASSQNYFISAATAVPASSFKANNNQIFNFGLNFRY